jgi:hypothetical protein
VNVIAKYIPKKKCLQIKGFKERHGRGDRARLKKSHSFSMSFETFAQGGWLKGQVDLDEINNLEQKKSPRPKWKHQVRLVESKELGTHFVNVKTGKPLEKHYNLKVFLEDSKVFVL